MGLLFRPTAGMAVQHKKFAARMARSLAASGGTSTHKLFDGYIFRATRSGDNTVVVALDVEAVWAFLHWDVLPGEATQFFSGMRALTRQRLAPRTPDPDNPLVPKPRTDTLARWLPNASAYLTFDTNALQVVSNMQSVPRVTAEGVTAALQLATSDNNEFTSDRYQVVVSSLPYIARFYAVDADPTMATVRERNARDVFFSESALVSVTGDTNAKLQPRKASRYNYSVPTFGAQVGADCFASRVEGGLDYDDVVLGGAYVSQANSSNDLILPEDPDPAREGVAGVWLVRLRRFPVPFDPDVLIQPTSLVWSFKQLMTNNPEPTLRPTTYTASGHSVRVEHAVEGVAIAAQRVFTPPITQDGSGAKGWVALFYTTRCAEGEAVPPMWRALQVTKVLAGGTATTVTVRVSTDDTHNMLGPELRMFGAEGIAATQFAVVGGVMDQTTVRLIHVSADGVQTDTDIHTEGWFPFTDYLLNQAAGSLFGQAARWAVSIGNDKVAVIARNTHALPEAVSMEWHLVIVKASTGEFLETRGPIGVAVTVNPFAHLSVVTPEVVRGEATVDAVLTCSLGNGHKISTNGGRTWEDLFSGTFGVAVYLGNQLHPITIEQTL